MAVVLDALTGGNGDVYVSSVSGCVVFKATRGFLWCPKLNGRGFVIKGHLIRDITEGGGLMWVLLL